ncbi:MAG: hypothetical protein OXC54_09395 [Rhodospirillaceae bacterium]|nr:hypothetical protein [Rhodospirillaceae bacterium]MCY4311506.1 hypothetical protein [Rhodospirillaceae bacterium]
MQDSPNFGAAVLGRDHAGRGWSALGTLTTTSRRQVAALSRGSVRIGPNGLGTRLMALAGRAFGAGRVAGGGL